MIYLLFRYFDGNEIECHTVFFELWLEGPTKDNISDNHTLKKIYIGIELNSA